MTTAFYCTAHEVRIPSFRRYGPLVIPAGLRCRPITTGGTAGKFFLDQLPVSIFPTNSFLRHDATYYGVVIESADVKIANPGA